MSYWERADLADVGGELHARNHAVRVLLAAQPDCGGTWTGYYDALFFSGTGVSGPTRPMPSRLDALSTAAHAVARHCRRLLDSSAGRADRRAAAEVERFNRTLLEEWAYVRPYTSNQRRTRALTTWLHNYNHHRVNRPAMSAKEEAIMQSSLQTLAIDFATHWLQAVWPEEERGSLGVA
jgi:hypothetical protein